MTRSPIDNSDQTRLKRNPNIIASQIDGETVMMDEEFDSYFGMARVGAFIWQQLETEITFGELIARLLAASGGTAAEDRRREEPREFQADLLENDFLSLSEPWNSRRPRRRSEASTAGVDRPSTMALLSWPPFSPCRSGARP